jgi:Flp pilus assembly protein TadD
LNPPGIDLRPWLAEALGRQLRSDYPGALLLYRRILSRDPDHADAWCNLGFVLRELGQAEPAQEACQRALALAPGNPIVHCNLGLLAQDRADLEGALRHYRRALALDPEHVPALSCLAAVLGRLGRLDEALAADERALALEPDRAELHLNRGYTRMRSGHLAEAEADLSRALALEPNLPRATWNLAYLRLLQNRHREAWPDFGARLQVPEARNNLREYPQPRWRGQPFPGQTLLVWVEQGLGDTLQFVRYLPRVKALGGRVLFQTYDALLGLLGDIPGADQVLGEHGQPPAFDLQVPLLDLPALFQSTPQDLPADVPYLATPQGYRPPAELARLLALAGPHRVALAWAGSPAHADDARRSLDPALLSPLATLPGIQWLSLQVGPRALPPLPGLVQLGGHLPDFRATAWALEQCDLLITVDTAIVHLAGAMGVPALLLLPFFPDWRWAMTGAATPWYPTLRIYRQPAPGDWPAVIAQLRADLS